MTKLINISLFGLLLLSIGLLASFHPMPFLSQYDEKRIIEIIILSLISFLFIFSKPCQATIIQFFSRLSSFNKLSFISFFSLGITSSIFSTFPIFSFLEVSHYFLLFLLTLFISQIIYNYPWYNKLIISTFVGAALLYSIAFFAALAGGISQSLIDINDLAPGFFNRRFLNQFQSMSFPLLLAAPFIFKTNKLQYFSLSILAAFWVMLMLTTSGRGVMFASLFGIIVSGIILDKARKQWWLHSLFVITLGLTLFALFSWLISNFQVVDSDIARITSGGRFQIWAETLNQSKDALFFGNGPMHYAFIPKGTYTVAHPHNITLQLIYEWGIPATFLFIILIFTGFLKWITYCKNNNNSLLTISLTSSFVAALIHGHLSGVFVMPLSQLSFVLICGWMFSIYFSDTNIFKAIKNKGETKQYYYNFLVILFSGLALTALLIGSFAHFKYPPSTIERKDLYLNGIYPAATHPRFWSGTLVTPPSTR